MSKVLYNLLSSDLLYYIDLVVQMLWASEEWLTRVSEHMMSNSPKHIFSAASVYWCEENIQLPIINLEIDGQSMPRDRATQLSGIDVEKPASIQSINHSYFYSANIPGEASLSAA